jgi:hypothetical protein
MTSPLPEPEKPAVSEGLAPGQSSGSRPPGEQGLIEEVLHHTSHALVSPQPLSDVDKRALEDVAARMHGKPLETVVAELVLAVLKQHISGLPGFDDLAPALSQRVAKTLIDDPTAKTRLESLWNRLQGGPA